MRLQINGFATILYSKNLPENIKNQILQAEQGKRKIIMIRLTDVDGNPFELKGTLTRSKQGSLMARFTASSRSFELLEIERSTKKPKENEKDLATELLA